MNISIMRMGTEDDPDMLSVRVYLDGNILSETYCDDYTGDPSTMLEDGFIELLGPSVHSKMWGENRPVVGTISYGPDDSVSIKNIWEA